ncbi:MAG: MFS transporter [Pseudomonadota bacterium]
MRDTLKTTWLLAAINAATMSAMTMMVFIGSIIGDDLAPAESWSTIPIAAMVVGSACGVLPVTRSMHRFGRRIAFGLFFALGAGSCLLASSAIASKSFGLFCLAAVGLGVMVSAVLQLRFAAMESVSPERAPTAASIILASGIAAAWIGPEITLLGKDLTAATYQGSFLLGAVCLVAATALLSAYRTEGVAAEDAHGEGRSWQELIRNPTMVLAVASAATAYMVMTFIMTATPISMHVEHHHSLEDTKWVIQSHISAMYLPSLFTAFLFKVLGIRALMVIGILCFCSTISIGLYDASVLGFLLQLVILGIGWNFLFVAGTALLPTTHRPEERFTAQGLNDTVMISVQAIGSISAGFAVAALSWGSLVLLGLLPMAVMAAMLVWERTATAAGI